VIRYGLRSFTAHLRASRSLFLLTVLGVALGIASVLSIQIINRSALGAFRGSLEAVSGDADLAVLPRLPTLPESLLTRVLDDPAVSRAWPLYQVTVALVGRERFYLDVVGLDFLAPIRLPLAGDRTADLGAAMTDSGWAVLAPALAAELHLARGDRFEVSSGTRRARLHVGALVDFQRLTPLASRRLVAMDIAQAQALLGDRGQLTEMDVRLAAGADAAATRDRLRARLGPAVDVLTPTQREQRAEGLMRAFRLNLTALSLISLVVGFFLVHSSTQAALVRRRTELGILRAAGATRGQVLGLLLAEGSVLGLLGVAAGLPLGVLAAKANLAVVSATITNLYLLGAIERLDVPASLYLLAAGLGLAAALLGALGPALELSGTDVKELLAALTLHERAGALAAPLAALGLALPAGAAAWYAAWGRTWQPAGFVLAVAVLLAVPLVSPWLVQHVAARARVRSFGFGYAVRSLGVRLQTTAFAVTSLAIAVSMLVGITVMVASFRRTVTAWVDQTLHADIYVTTPSWRGAGAQGTLDSAMALRLVTQRGVRTVDRLRGFAGWVGERRIGVVGVDFSIPEGGARFALLAGTPATAYALVRDSGAVLISEPLARKTGLWAGDSLPLTTPGGVRLLRIAGVTYDYSSENGAVAMDAVALDRLFGPGALNSVALYLQPGVDPERLIDRIRAQYPGVPLNLRSNRSLRAEVLRIFDQTFAVTRLLQVMALIVAASGITLTLLILGRERASELAVYRALGARRRQVFRFFVGKGLGIGLFGMAIGLAAGAALAGILIFVINRAYFGWTIRVWWPWGQLGAEGATIALAALAASIIPALRASRTTARDLSRDDL
jgi:putative ABC transport system permease protein